MIQPNTLEQADNSQAPYEALYTAFTDLYDAQTMADERDPRAYIEVGDGVVMRFVVGAASNQVRVVEADGLPNSDHQFGVYFAIEHQPTEPAVSPYRFLMEKQYRDPGNPLWRVIKRLALPGESGFRPEKWQTEALSAEDAKAYGRKAALIARVLRGEQAAYGDDVVAGHKSRLRRALGWFGLRSDPGQ